MMQLIRRYYRSDLPKCVQSVTEDRVEFDRGMEEQSTVRQADGGHPRADVHAEMWQLERPIHGPEIRG
jgi:hypothetical protein